MNLNEVKNVFGRSTPGGNNNNSNQSIGGSLIFLSVAVVAGYLVYKYVIKSKEPRIKINDE